MNNKFFLILSATLMLSASCKKDKPKPPVSNTPGTVQPYASGVFVVNEGQFSGGSGTVYHFNRSSKAVQEDIFSTVNNRPAGSVAHSLSFYNGKGYLVLNNSAKIEVVDAGSFKSVSTISGFISPRYFTGAGNKGYVSDWGNEGVVVINLSNGSVIKTISTGKGPEQMLYQDGFLYVVNGGDWSDPDYTLSVINVSNDSLEAQIVVGDKPNSLVLDKDGFIWVLCGGIYDWMNPANDTPGKLVKVNRSTRQVETAFLFPTTYMHPGELSINKEGDALVFLNDLYAGALYTMSVSAASLPAAPIVNRSFYGLGVDPSEGFIYASNPVDYQQKGWVCRYGFQGNLVDSFRVGIIPGAFAFR